MNILRVFIVVLITFSSIRAKAQSEIKSRGLLQQEFISEHFITPQWQNSGTLKISSTKTIDSLFTVINNQWIQVAPDTLNKYKLDIALEDFKHIDAYCYFWTLASVSQSMNLPVNLKKHLVRSYMIPAMERDYVMLKQNPDFNTIRLIHGGTLQNTLAIGSQSGMDKETVQSTYQLYMRFSEIFESLANSTDTAVGNYAKGQLNEIGRFKYDLNAQVNYYDRKEDESLNYVIEGLHTNNYPRSRVFSMSKMLINDFIDSGKKDKSFLLLNALTINTTSDNISKDTLLNWYIKVDPVQGKEVFDNTLSRMSRSSFKKAEKSITLPEKWNFLVNMVDSERIKKAKYYLVDVWYTSCAPCIFEIPDLNAFNEKIKNRDDVQLISINTDFFNGKLDETYVAKRSAELGIQFPVVYDNANNNITEKLAVQSFPSKFIIDNTGQIMMKIDNSPISLKAFEVFIAELSF